MATKAFKSEKIDAIKAKVEKAQVAILTEYKGYSVEEITNLRRALQKDGGDYMVTKNTLAKIAVKGTDFEVLADALDGKFLSAKEAEELAKMPSKEELIAKILGSVNSPASGIVGSINAVMSQLTRTMAAVRDAKA